MFNEEYFEEKKIEFANRIDYLNFLLNLVIKKRKNEIKDFSHKYFTFNDKENCFVLPEPNLRILKNIKNENFFILIPGDFTKDYETLTKVLELFLMDRLVFLKGKYEFYGLFYEDFPLSSLKKLIELTPVFYYNTLYKFGLTISGISNSLNEKEFITKTLSPEIIEKNQSLKQNIVEFMDYFKIRLLLRRGQREFYYEIDKNHSILSFGDKIVIIDTEIKILDREHLSF